MLSNDISYTKQLLQQNNELKNIEFMQTSVYGNLL